MTLTLSEDASFLMALWTPEPRSPDIGHCLEQLARPEYREFFALHTPLNELMLHLQTTPDQPFRGPVAQRKDMAYQVFIDPQALQAELHYQPAYGGKTFSPEDVEHVIQDLGIRYGIQGYIYQLLSENPPEGPYLLAQGKKPLPGTDTQFIPLVEEAPDKGKPKITSQEKVDFKDLQWLTLVEAGDALMKKTPPSAGVSGRNIYGEEIEPQTGRALPFGLSKGSRPHPDDPDLLIADHAGQVQIYDDQVSVLQVLELPHVNLKTGHIHFPGTIVVHQHIHEGFEVVSEGDIFVQGRVEGAQVSAQKELFIQHGVVGQGKAQLQSRSMFQTRFIEQAQVLSPSDIHVSDQVLHSHLISGEQVRVGTPFSKGHIIGGRIQARTRIEAKVVGSTAHTKTWLEVGDCPIFHQESKALEVEIAHLKIQLSKVTEALLFHRIRKQSGLSGSLESLRHSLSLRMQEIEFQRTRLKAQNSGTYLDAKIYVSKRIYPGVTVKIGPLIRRFDEGFSGATLYIDRLKNDIVIGSI